jgi:putative peptidoglycan lipid II flippase
MQNPTRAEGAAAPGGGFVGSARVLSALTLLSRVLGMVRDMLTAAVFGLTPVLDAFNLAYLIPNLFRRLFGEGALGSAFVPVFVDHLEHQGKPAAARLLSALVTATTLILSLVCVLGIGAALLLPRFWSDPRAALVGRLLAVMLPYAVLVCVTAILSAALNSLHRFAIPAAAPILLNVLMIGALLVAVAPLPQRATLLASSVVAAGALQVLIQIPPLWRLGIGLRPTLNWTLPGMREVGRLFVPATLGVSLLQVNELIDGVIAAGFTDAGGVSSLAFAGHLAYLPMALIGIALATAIFPTLARAAAHDERDAFEAALARGLRATLFLAIPAALGLLLLPDLIVQVIYERDRFSAEDTRRTGRVLFCYALGLVFYTSNHLFVRAFHARKDTRTPFRIMGLTTFLNLGLNLVLVQTALREAGLALATSVSGLVNLLALALVLRRKHGVRRLAGVASTVLRSLLIAALTAAVLIPLRDPTLTPIGAPILRLALAIAAALAITFGLGRLLCRAEVRDILGRAPAG